MSVNASTRAGLVAVSLLAILGSGQICSAQCKYPDDVQGGGIWVYDEPLTYFSITVINPTPYQLTGTDHATTPSAVEALGTANSEYPFQTRDLSVDPYRGLIWKSPQMLLLYTTYYFGRMRFHLQTSLWAHTFEVNFVHQSGYGTAGRKGTWVALAQTKLGADPAWMYDVWCAPSTLCGNVWATTWMQPIGLPNTWSVDPRNIMTLTTNELVVALYSPDNKNVVLVVRDTSNGSDVFHQVMSEWADNDETSMPGPCNRK